MVEEFEVEDEVWEEEVAALESFEIFLCGKLDSSSEELEPALSNRLRDVLRGDDEVPRYVSVSVSMLVLLLSFCFRIVAI